MFMRKLRSSLAILIILSLILTVLPGCTAKQVSDTLNTVSDIIETVQEVADNLSSDTAPSPEPTAEPTPAIDENGSYTTKEDVALYIYTYGRLPSNFVTKKDAQAAGWSGGSLEKYLPGKCIGGSRFGNYEGLLPDAEGRVWTECDINTIGAKTRGAERIVFSNDGLIYYTGDHYETFELLYGTP